MKLIYLIVCLMLSTAAFSDGATALDTPQIAGTVSVQFHPTQAAGVLGACTLVYTLAQQDFVYRKGAFISIVGNIAYFTNKNQDMIGLSLKIGTVDSSSKTAKPEAPFYAYIQTPNGTTAKSKFQDTTSDTPGAKVFVYELDEGSMAVLKDIMEGQAVSIGFNREKDGLDVLSALDLRVADSTVRADGSIRRHQSRDAIDKFVSCVANLTKQVQARNQRAREATSTVPSNSSAIAP